MGGHYSAWTPITIELVNYKFVFVPQRCHTDTQKSDKTHALIASIAVGPVGFVNCLTASIAILTD